MFGFNNKQSPDQAGQPGQNQYQSQMPPGLSQQPPGMSGQQQGLPQGQAQQQPQQQAQPNPNQQQNAQQPSVRSQTLAQAQTAQQGIPPAFDKDFDELMNDALSDTNDVITRLDLIQFIDNEIKKFLLEKQQLDEVKTRLNTIQKDEKKLLMDPSTGELRVVISHNEEVQDLEKDLADLFHEYVLNSEKLAKLVSDRAKLFQINQNLNSSDISGWTTYLKNLWKE